MAEGATIATVPMTLYSLIVNAILQVDLSFQILSALLTAVS